jgi:O-antigen/teichoic acid export membrane protein
VHDPGGDRLEDLLGDSARAASVGPSLMRGVGWNGVAQALPILAQLVITPYLIRVLGLDGFGVWSLFLVFLGTLTALDGGVGASLARFLAIDSAEGNKARSGRLLCGAGIVFIALGLAVTVLAVFLGPSLLALLHIPVALEAQATAAFRWLGVLVTLALGYSAVSALLQATQHFAALSMTSAASAVAFVAAALILLRPGVALSTMVWLWAIRYVTGIGFGLIAGRRELRLSRPFLPTRPEVAEFRRYAGRMQLSVMTSFLNGEVDAVVVAAIFPVRYVGLFAVAHQMASAARSLPLYAFPPFLSRLATAFASGGRAGAVAEFERLQRVWFPPVVVYGAVATVVAGFAVPVWLGDDFRLAGLLAAILTLGYCIQVTLTGMRTCFVRSIGRPGLETRYAMLSTVINVVLTIPLALWLGVVGVVVATAVSLATSSVYFVWLCRDYGLSRDSGSGRLILAVAGATFLAIVGEVLILRAEWHGRLALVAAGLVAVVSLSPILLIIRHHLSVTVQARDHDAKERT